MVAVNAARCPRLIQLEHIFVCCSKISCWEPDELCASLRRTCSISQENTTKSVSSIKFSFCFLFRFVTPNPEPPLLILNCLAFLSSHSVAFIMLTPSWCPPPHTLFQMGLKMLTCLSFSRHS